MYKLRPYQEEAVKTGIQFFLKKSKLDKAYMVLPTGSGKSIVIAEIARQLPGNVIVFQPSKELLEQNYNKFISYGNEASIYSASFNTKEIGKVTFATIGSAVNNLSLFAHFEYIIVDECHLLSPDEDSMYSKFFKAVDKFKVLGLTATPVRLKSYMFPEQHSKLNMLHRTRPKIFQDIIHVTQLKELYEQNYLTPVKYLTKPQDNSMLKVNTTGADYAKDSIYKFFYYNDIGKQIAEATDEVLRLGYKHVLIFVPSIDEAESFADKIPNAAFVHSKIKKEERDSILTDFKAGKIKVVVNVGILTTGFDFPELDVIINARPTMSFALYYQIIGREIRIAPNKKEALYIDFTSNYSKFGAIDTITIEKVSNKWEITQNGRVITHVAIQDLNLNEKIKMPFGKWAGTEVRYVPKDYLQWFVKNVENNAKTKHIIEHILTLI